MENLSIARTLIPLCSSLATLLFRTLLLLRLLQVLLVASGDMQLWLQVSSLIVQALPVRDYVTRVLQLYETSRHLSGESTQYFEKYRGTPPISIAILLQTYSPFLVESRSFTANLYHNMLPIRIAILFQKYWGQGWLEHPQTL